MGPRQWWRGTREGSGRLGAGSTAGRGQVRCRSRSAPSCGMRRGLGPGQAEMKWSRAAQRRRPQACTCWDYGAALRGLCEDALEGLLFLLLFSLLSAGALAATLCSLPRAWALFPPSDDYDDTDDDDPFNPQESKRFVQWQSSI